MSDNIVDLRFHFKRPEESKKDLRSLAEFFKHTSLFYSELAGAVTEVAERQEVIAAMAGQNLEQVELINNALLGWFQTCANEFPK